MNEHTPHTEPLRIVADHMVVERSGELAIIDTGVPSSLSCPSVVTEVLGLPVARLIGCSELAEEPLEIDWPGRRLVRGAAPRPGAVAAPLTPTSFGVPRIAIATRAGTIQAVLDTGAALSYAPPG